MLNLLTSFCLWLCAPVLLGQIQWNDGFPAVPDNQHDFKHLSSDNLLSVLEKVAIYFSEAQKNSTLDFAFGMRLVEGELKRILKLSELGVYTEVTKNIHLQNRLTNLMSFVNKSVQNSMLFISDGNKKYYNKLQFVIKNAFDLYQLPPQFVELNDDEYPPVKFEDTFSEEESDACMAKLLGTEGNDVCSVASCWKLMTEPGHTLYGPTHQLLWLLLGYKRGCYTKMNKLAVENGFSGGFNDLIKRLCAGIFIEMEAIAADGIKPGFQDIFLEQGSLCAGIGFMHRDMPLWLLSALKWQDPESGCFRFVEESDVMEDEMKQFKFWLNVKRDQWKSRKVLVDTVLEDGCSTHTTGVGAGFLATFLRLFYDPVFYRQIMIPYFDAYGKEYAKPGKWNSIFFLLACMAALCVTFILFRRRTCIHFYNSIMRRLQKTQTPRYQYTGV